MTRHYLDEHDLSAQEFLHIVQRGIELKALRAHDGDAMLAYRRTLAMIFTKASTRTRVSFETGMAQMGGHAIMLDPQRSQLGRGEPLSDTARVFSQMVDVVMIRNDSQADQVEFAAASSIPVINGLSERLHPCQMLADIQTWVEHHGTGDWSQRSAAWIGDGNNVCNSWINAAALLGFQLRIACPEGYEPDSEYLDRAGDRVFITRDPAEAMHGVQCVSTDVWTSMGQEDESRARETAFAGYQVDTALMQKADPQAIFLHCLPAHRAEEVSAEVIDGSASVVWQQAGNRLHAQKALLEFLL